MESPLRVWGWYIWLMPMIHRKREIIILGSTGSIGTSGLSTVRENPERFDVVGLSCENNLDLLAEQIDEGVIVTTFADHGSNYPEVIKELSEVLKTS